MDNEGFLRILRDEIALSMGCTDPAAVCLAVSRAVRELGARPDRVDVTVSPNVYKNGAGVGVPGTGMRGLEVAAALGAVLENGDAGLAMLDGVTPELLTAALELLGGGRVTVQHVETEDPLYIRADVRSGRHRAHAVIAGDYTKVAELGVDGRITRAPPGAAPEAAREKLRSCRLEEVFMIIESLDPGDLSFLLEAAEVNRKAAIAGLANPSGALGQALSRVPPEMPVHARAAAKAQALTAAASEARMSGMRVPIYAISGSGNHGITCFLGLLAAGEALGNTGDQIARALAIGAAVTVIIKSYTSRLSALCGCSIAAAAGVAAGAAYLMGGDYEDSVHAIQSVIGTLAGMVCDGAKESCAFKLSSSAALAVQFSHLAISGAYIPAGMGIVGGTIEKTFENLGKLNNPGMVAADRLMLQMIGEARKNVPA